MSANIKTATSHYLTQKPLNQAGTTILELLVVTAVAGLLVVSSVTVMLFFYGDVLRGNLQSRLAVESQNVLRAVVEDLRISSSIRANNSIADANAPGGSWTTSNSNLILIISTPAVDSSNGFIIDSLSGYPYQNEIVYFASGDTLFKRVLANPSASGNRFKTTCPAALASSACPGDVVMSDNFETMDFKFYNQDNNLTTDLTLARSIEMSIDMQRQSFGKEIVFNNNIRITLRNTAALP